MAEVEQMLGELRDMKTKVELLQSKIMTQANVQDDDRPLDLDEMRELLGMLLEKQTRMESTFGVEKVNLKDAGDRIVVTIDTNFGVITTHADKGQGMSGEKGGQHSPVTYSGSTVAGTGGPAPGVGGGKGGGQHGMTPEQLQEFKKQTLQIGAAQQKLKELETKLNDATVAIKRGIEKSIDMEEKEAESIKELYTCLDSINTSLSEKIALQKVEVQKIAGDTPKPINYDPFNYGEAYAGDVVDFQARKRITELKLLMHGLQTALLQMRDSMKVSPSIDLGYKVVRLDQLVGSTGFGQKVQSGEVGSDEVLVTEQSGERMPGKVEYPRKSMNQTSPEMESKWAITDSIMQTMYRLEMELGEIQKLVDSTGLSSGSKVIEEVHQSIRNLKDKQIDIKTVKRLIEDSKDSTVNLMASAGRKSNTPGNPRNTLPQIMSENNSEANLQANRKIDQTLRQMQRAIANLNSKLSGQKHFNIAGTSAATRKNALGKSCMSCDRTITADARYKETPKPSIPMYSYFSPLGAKPRIHGPPTTQMTINRVFGIEVTRDRPENMSIPRPCGGGYSESWPLPRSFDYSRFQKLYETPPIIQDTQYMKGSDGHYYRTCTRYTTTQRHIKEQPMTIAQKRRLARQGKNTGGSKAEGQPQVEKKSGEDSDPNVKVDIVAEDAPVAVVVMAASDDGMGAATEDQLQLEEEEALEREMDMQRRHSLEHKKYKFKIPDEQGVLPTEDLNDDEEANEGTVTGTGTKVTEAGQETETDAEEGSERTGGKQASGSDRVSDETTPPEGVVVAADAVAAEDAVPVAEEAEEGD